jgi:hypothetical protein
MVNEAQATALRDELLGLIDAARDAEEELFTAVAPEARTRIAIGEWSPKDVYAHLAAWRDRQAGRMESMARGEEPEATSSEEIDVVNARLHDERAHWPWERVVEEAKGSAERLRGAVADLDAQVLLEREGLIGGIMGNGPSHDLEHLPAIARIAGREERVSRLIARVAEVAERGAFPDSDAGILLYNVACWASLDGRLDEARGLLTRAFRLRPDLIEYAPSDSDLAALHAELQQLATG